MTLVNFWHLLEVNSSRVQNDALNRIQESRDRLEVEIRKLLHEISRIAEQAVDGRGKSKKKELPPYSRQLSGSTD
jgi:hypothetical protein